MSTNLQSSVRPSWECLDRERARIAAVLHEGVAQSLAGLAFRAQLLSEDLKREGGARLDDVATVMRDVEECVRQVRALSLTLDPSRLLENGLAEAIEELALALPPQQRARLHVRRGATAVVLPPEPALHAFDIACELVRAALHSPHARVSVEVTLFAGRARVWVDAGVANTFPQREYLSTELQNRVAALRADLDIAPSKAWVALEFDAGMAPSA